MAIGTKDETDKRLKFSARNQSFSNFLYVQMSWIRDKAKKIPRFTKVRRHRASSKELVFTIA